MVIEKDVMFAMSQRWIKKNSVPDGFTNTNSQTGAETSGK